MIHEGTRQNLVPGLQIQYLQRPNVISLSPLKHGHVSNIVPQKFKQNCEFE